MKAVRRMMVGLLLLCAATVGVGALVWMKADKRTRQEYRIRGLDRWHALGFALPARDLAHLREHSGLLDVSNVSCRNCHGETTNSLAWARPRAPHASPGGLAISSDGRRLYVTLPLIDEVWELDTDSLRLLRRTTVAGAPTGVAFGPDGAGLLVGCREGDRVARLDSGSFHEMESVFVGLEPVGLAWAATTNGPRAIVANLGSDDVSLLAFGPLREIGRLSAGRQPYAVGFGEGGRRAYAAARLAGMAGVDRPPQSELTVIDVSRGRVTARPMMASSHLSEAVVAVPGRDWVLAPVVRVRNLVPITQVARGWVMSGGLAISDGAGREVVQVPVDEAHRYHADPAGLVVDPTGKRAFLASAGGDVVSVIDLDRLAAWLQGADAEAKRTAIDDLGLAESYVIARIPVGRNPRQLVMAPDGMQLYVAEYLDDAVAVIDTRTLTVTVRAELGDPKVRFADPVRRGERMFTWAGKTFQGQFSCRSCHPDGHMDGLNYDFDGDGVGDNLLDNRSLRGLAGTWPFKWNGKNPSLSVQCGPRFAKVLMRTDPFDGQQLEDLTRYVESLPPARTRHVNDMEWSAARERGRTLFFATNTPAGKPIPVARRCSTCHRPPLFTNRSKTAVGTRGPQDQSDEFDTPHLLGIGASAPYLHDGRAKSLEELWTLYQTNDLHGVSSYMSKQQLNDLVEFLKTL